MDVFPAFSFQSQALPKASPGAPAVSATLRRAAWLPCWPTTLPEARDGKSAACKAAAAVQVHPGLWLGHQLGRQAERALPTGFAALDAELPGGGWPHRGLAELLLTQPLGIGEIRLLAPALVAVQQAGRLVMLFDPPAELSAPALAQLGFDVPQLLSIQTREANPGNAPGAAPCAAASDPRNSLWALEQALKSGHVGAVLAWLPPLLRADHLRRLQLAAQSHDGPAFVLRPWWGHEARAHANPTSSALRLGLRPAAGAQGTTGAGGFPSGAERLSIQLLKRRGPPRLQPLLLDLPSVLPMPLAGTLPVRTPGQPAAAASPPALRPATFVNLA